VRPLTLTSLSCALYLAACTPADPPASETGETDPSASDTSATEASVTEASAPATEASVTEASATEASATEASATEASATDTGETDTGELPAGCEEADPAVKFELEFAFAAWDPNEDAVHEVDTTCVVGESSLDAGVVTTALSCELDGVAQPASVRYSAAALDQDYATGEQVTVKSKSYSGGEIDLGVEVRFTMRSMVDDRLLIAAMRGETVLPEWSAPLVVEALPTCGPDGNDIVFPMEVRVTSPSGPSVSVFHGRSGALDLGDGFAYAIDVEEATLGNCCHYALWHQLLLRRVKT
jgi:hypothetical protein